MPKGKKIAENPELEAFVIELFKKGCAYRDIVKKAKDRFDIKIPASLLSEYKKNYLPPEVVLPGREKKRKRPPDKKEIDEGHEGEVLIRGDGILNWYISSITHFEEERDKLLKLKKGMNEEEMKIFISLTNTQDKLYQRVLKLYEMEVIRENEMKNFGADILDRLTKVFARTVPREEKIRISGEEIYQNFGKRLEEEMDIIFMKWFGEKM